MNNSELIKKVSYIKRSKNRLKVVKIIDETFKMPSEIAKDMDLRINQVSAILSDLKKERIVVCINEEEKTGRLYRLTNIGLGAYDLIKENEKSEYKNKEEYNLKENRKLNNWNDDYHKNILHDKK